MSKIQNGTTMFDRRLGSSAQIVLLSTFSHIFAYSFYTQGLFTTKEHIWTLDTATLTCFKTLYPRIQRGHWRFFRTRRRTKATWIIPGSVSSRSTTGNVLESATDWGKGLTVLLYRILLTNVQSLENKVDDLRARCNKSIISAPGNH